MCTSFPNATHVHPTSLMYTCTHYLYNWRGPRKPAPSDKFVVIFQVAQNPLKFAMPTLFLCKNVPVFWLSRIEILRWLETDRERGGGGGTSPNFVHIFMPFEKRNTRTFFNTRRVNMANFSGFWATCKIITKLPLGAGLPGDIQLYKYIQFICALCYTILYDTNLEWNVVHIEILEYNPHFPAHFQCSPVLHTNLLYDFCQWHPLQQTNSNIKIAI